MTTWRDELGRVRMPDGRVVIAASFRGVPFFIDRAERTGGRRTVTHEFPNRNEPALEDLGRKAITFPVEAYVLGDDYHKQRNALIEALEADGPGELIHPYFGTHQAISDASLRVVESKRDGGIATFTILFQRWSPASSSPPPVADPDLDAEVGTAATAVLVGIAEEFAADYDIDDAPAFTLESLEAEIVALTNGMRAQLEPLADTAQAAAELAEAADDLVAAAATLVLTPSDIAGDVSAMIRKIKASAAVPAKSLVRALLDGYATLPTAQPTADTANRDLERANLDALGAMVRRQFLIEAAIVIVDAVYETTDEATAGAAEVAAALDAQAATAGDVVYPQLIHLRARVLRAVPGRAILARVLTIERSSTVPSLMLAYGLYGNVDSEADVVDRNSSQHPAFMGGALKVLSSV